ncbi:Methyltransf-25 domain-containing protein [Mycena kentingensis (nom. inval.)]|nr:Methyltransf-25 domain-containing protein [Mycena kentingensis (nom. inval.)]
MTFPPPALPHLEEENSSESESDSDDARNALVPRPSRRQSAISIVASSPRSTTFSDALALSEEHRWVHTSELVKRESRYISLDESRMSGYSPSARASFPAMSPIKSTTDLPVLELPEASSAGPHARASANRAPVSAGSRNRLPNQTLNIDMRSLNMHLALRTAEVIACSESMWEWVTKYQKEVVAQRAAGRPRAGSLASELTPRSSRPPVLPPDPELDAFKNAILELTREDFDALLVKFDLDMRDHMAIASTLRDHFSWPCIPLAPSAERKAFNAACERWEQWQEQQRRKVKLPFSHARASVDEDRNGHGNAKRDRRRSSSTTSSSAVAPDRKLSRSIRVFAAWKA